MKQSKTLTTLALLAGADGLTWEDFVTDIAEEVSNRIGLISPIKKKEISDRKVRGIRKLSQYLQSSTATIQRMVNDGSLPYSKIGNRLIFNLDEVDEALRWKGGEVK